MIKELVLKDQEFKKLLTFTALSRTFLRKSGIGFFVLFLVTLVKDRKTTSTHFGVTALILAKVRSKNTGFIVRQIQVLPSLHPNINTAK